MDYSDIDSPILMQIAALKSNAGFAYLMERYIHEEYLKWDMEIRKIPLTTAERDAIFPAWQVYRAAWEGISELVNGAHNEFHKRMQDNPQMQYEHTLTRDKEL